MKNILACLIAICTLAPTLFSQGSTPRNPVYQPIQRGASLPAACNPTLGEHYIVTGVSGGLYRCSATNTWTTVSASGGSVGGASNLTTAGRIAKVSSAGVVTQTTGLFEDGSGNVGIGTTGPSQKLDVSGTSRVTGEASFGNLIRGAALGAGTIDLDYGGTTNTIQLGFTDAANLVTIKDTGNVGIGTTSPTSGKLVIDGGHLTFGTDNTYDIGANGANRPRSVYAALHINAGGDLQAGGSGGITWAGRTEMKSPANGNLVVWNAANTDFGLFQFGGTTSSFPALKRNGTQIDVRLSDDSGAAPLSASLFKTAANCASGASPAVCGAASAGAVALPAAGTMLTVNTTAVSATSRILITENTTVGTELSVTCNSTMGRAYAVTAITAGTSFVITTDAAPTTNPACLSYFIVN